MPTDDPNFYEDIPVVHGTTLVWGFSIQPLDLTGASASIVVGTLGTFALVIDADADLPAPASDVTWTVAASTTTGWAPGLYSYQILMTFADGSVCPYGRGQVVVT